MSKRTVSACDRCGREAASLPEMFVVTGRSATPAGDCDDDGENVDICAKCLEAAIYKFLLAPRDYARNKEFLAWAKAGRSKP